MAYNGKNIFQEEKLRRKKKIHVAFSCILLTVVMSAFVYVFPSVVTATSCVLFMGIFFCLAVSYQKAVNYLLILALGALGIMGCFYYIATT